MIQSLYGTLKGVNMKSKVEDDASVTTTVEIKLQLIEGENPRKVQDYIARLKEIVELKIDSKQPSLLDGSLGKKKKAQDEEEEEED